MRVRRHQMIATMVAVMVATSTVALAQTTPSQTTPKFETFTGTTANLTVGAGQTLKMNVLRWASDDDRNRAIASFTDKGDQQLLDAFRSQPSTGYVWSDETLGYSIRYASRQPLPDGGERIILLTDRPLGSWSGQPWKAASPLEGVDYPFTLLELRLNRAGSGEGKMSLTTKVTLDQEARTIALEHFQAAPVLLRGVKRETTSGGH